MTAYTTSAPTQKMWADAQVHNSLLPYIRSMVEETHNTGIPVMRHMALEYPELKLSSESHEQYSFGDRMIVAPNSPAAREYIVQLPRPASTKSVKVEGGELLHQPQSGQDHSALLHIRGTNPTVKVI